MDQLEPCGTLPRYACALVAIVPETREALERFVVPLTSNTPHYINYQVVLVVQRASREAEALLEQLGGDVVIVRCDPALDRLTAYRIGASSCASGVVVLLDQFSQVTEGWLDPLLRSLELERNTGAVVGRRVVMGKHDSDPRARVGALAVRREYFELFQGMNGSAPRASSHGEAAAHICVAVEKSGAGIAQQLRSSTIAAPPLALSP